jgi:hypothetical protein
VRSIVAVSLLLSVSITDAAEIIQSSNRIDWVVGATVGVAGGIPYRTNLLDVTTYGADKAGASNSYDAIVAAIAAASSNDVVYFPAGRYCISNALSITKNYITLRGEGTNSTIFMPVNSAHLLKAGPDEQQWSVSPISINSGATKGSTNFVIASAPEFAVGDQVQVSDSDFGAGSSTFPRIHVAYYDHILVQQCRVHAITGTTITIDRPLVWNFTNAPRVFGMGTTGIKGFGLENLNLTGTNTDNGSFGVTSFMLSLSMAQNSWVSNCSLSMLGNYGIAMNNCVNVTITRSAVTKATSAGSNHGGLLMSTVGGSLIENNIFADGLQPGIEFNNGVSGNAFFGNYFTNNVARYDVDNHGAHPIMNLWEANVLSGYFEMDGYFGSASHQTLFRNAILDEWVPIMLKRWNSYHQIVGNVLGNPGATYTNFTHDITDIGYQIIEMGRPNIGNPSFVGTNPPIAWNFPGWTLDDNGTPNGICVFTNDQVNVTNLVGNFTNIPVYLGNNGALIFQDAVDTNRYYPRDGVLRVPPVGSSGTISNIHIPAGVTVSNGWRAFWTAQNPPLYQQLDTVARATHTITGNYDEFNDSLTWDANGAQTIPASLLYSESPSWWGTNRWPAIDPEGSPYVAPIPAQLRYNGVGQGGGGDSPATPCRIRAGKVKTGRTISR